MRLSVRIPEPLSKKLEDEAAKSGNGVAEIIRSRVQLSYDLEEQLKKIDTLQLIIEKVAEVLQRLGGQGEETVGLLHSLVNRFSALESTSNKKEG